MKVMLATIVEDNVCVLVSGVELNCYRKAGVFAEGLAIREWGMCGFWETWDGNGAVVMTREVMSLIYWEFRKYCNNKLACAN